MQHITVLRGIAFLAFAVFGACDATRTSAPDSTAVRPVGMLGISAAYVTDSGGTPLISWSAVPDATSYSVELITYNTHNGEYQNRYFIPLVTTTGTSYLDTEHSYTGVSECTYEWGGYGHWYEYAIFVNYPNGRSEATRMVAPITSEGCYF